MGVWQGAISAPFFKVSTARHRTSSVDASNVVLRKVLYEPSVGRRILLHRLRRRCVQ